MYVRSTTNSVLLRALASIKRLALSLTITPVPVIWYLSTAVGANAFDSELLVR